MLVWVEKAAIMEAVRKEENHGSNQPGMKRTPFGPGCGHGILMSLILRAIDELKMDTDKIVFVSGIGCTAWIPRTKITPKGHLTMY
jgi:pyruvate/2-oxoacid:ferredoxin oxidoreductase beta subunit